MSIDGMLSFFSLCSGARQKEPNTLRSSPVSQVFENSKKEFKQATYSPLTLSSLQIESKAPTEFIFDDEEISEKSASAESEQEFEAKMPDAFIFGYEEISEESAIDPEQRLKELTQTMLDKLFTEANTLRKLKSPDAKKFEKKAKQLEKELNKNPIKHSIKKREYILNLDHIPNRDVSATNRNDFIGKIFKAITNYQKEDRIQACMIFLSKIKLTVEETAALIARLQQFEGMPGPESDALSYLFVVEHYGEIPKYQNADQALQKKMDQFLIDADHRVAIEKERAIRNKAHLTTEEIKRLNPR